MEHSWGMRETWEMSTLKQWMSLLCSPRFSTSNSARNCRGDEGWEENRWVRRGYLPVPKHFSSSIRIARKKYRSLVFHLPTSTKYLVTLPHKDLKDVFNTWNFLCLQRTTRLWDRYVGIHLDKHCNFSLSARICKPQTLKWARGYVNVPCKYLFLFSLAEAVK